MRLKFPKKLRTMRLGQNLLVLLTKKSMYPKTLHSCPREPLKILDHKFQPLKIWWAPHPLTIECTPQDFNYNLSKPAIEMQLSIKLGFWGEAWMIWQQNNMNYRNNFRLGNLCEVGRLKRLLSFWPCSFVWSRGGAKATLAPFLSCPWTIPACQFSCLGKVVRWLCSVLMFVWRFKAYWIKKLKEMFIAVS